MYDTADYSYILPTHRLTVYIMGILLAYCLRYVGKNYQIKTVSPYSKFYYFKFFFSNFIYYVFFFINVRIRDNCVTLVRYIRRVSFETRHGFVPTDLLSRL